jgi:hypothetical protein
MRLVKSNRLTRSRQQKELCVGNARPSNGGVNYYHPGTGAWRFVAARCLFGTFSRQIRYRAAVTTQRGPERFGASET